MKNNMLRVLIVEDKYILRRTLRMFLERRNCVIEEAVNGEIGVRKIWRNTYDIIFMDWGLPGKMLGTACATAIRGLPNRKKANVPIVGMSASHPSCAHIAEDFEEAGVYHVMPKPFEKDDVDRALGYAIIENDHIIKIPGLTHNPIRV